MKYKIKYNYDSADSFNSYPDNTDYLELEWENLDVVKANLQRIKEQYNFKNEIQRPINKKQYFEFLERYKEKDWIRLEYKTAISAGEDYDYITVIDDSSIDKYKEKYKIVKVPDTTLLENGLVLYTDEGNPWAIWPSWNGYFESLNYAEIEADESDMKIEF